MKISARNKLMGKVTTVERGAVNSVVKIELTGTPVITAVVTNEAVQDLELAEGSQACAVVKASNVLLGICNDGNCGCQN